MVEIRFFFNAVFLDCIVFALYIVTVHSMKIKKQKARKYTTKKCKKNKIGQLNKKVKQKDGKKEEKCNVAGQRFIVTEKVKVFSYPEYSHAWKITAFGETCRCNVRIRRRYFQKNMIPLTNRRMIVTAPFRRIGIQIIQISLDIRTICKN